MKAQFGFPVWTHPTTWQPPRVMRTVTTVLVSIAVVSVLVLPIDPPFRIQILLACVIGLTYALVLWTPFLPNKKDLADTFPFWVAVSNSLLVSMVVSLLYNQIPAITVVYLIAITGIGTRHGVRMALWSATVSALSYLFMLGQLGVLASQVNNAGLLIGTFFIVALFTGSLAYAAKKRARQFENVLRRSHDTIVIFDDQGTLEYVNPAMLKLSGYSLKEILGSSFFDFVIDPIDEAKKQTLWSWLKNHPLPARSFVLHIRAKDASTRILSVTLTRLDQNPTRYMATGRDITQQEIEREAHERRDRELEAERRVALAVSQGVGLIEVLKLALDQAVVCSAADAGMVYLADDAQTELTLVVSNNLPADYTQHIQHFRFGEGITGRSASERKTLIVPNLEQEPTARPVLPQIGIVSKITVPLITQDRVVGVLNVNGRRPHQFTEADSATLQAIASTVAIAIDHARLIESLEQRVQDRTAELVALNRIAQAGTQSLDLDAVLNATLHQVIDTLQIQDGWISLFDPDKRLLVMRAQVGIPSNTPRELCTQLIDNGLGSQVMKSSSARAIHLDKFDGSAFDLLRALGIQSLCAVPLTAAGHTLGILGLASHRKERFGEAELRWLTAVGNTIGSGLRNAQLYASVENQVIQLAALREIDRTLNSTLELAPMMEIILTSIAQVVPFDFAAVYLLEGTQMRAVAGRGIGMSRLTQCVFDTRGDLMYAKMMREEKPILIGDLDVAALHWTKIPDLGPIHSWMGVPLIARQRLIGQISLYSRAINQYTENHIDWMQAFSNLASIAIANALLRAELRMQARQDSLTQVLNHGAFIEDLRQACQHALKTGKPLALIMFDLDNFKHYNDTYGHVVGDLVLKLTTQAIRTHVKQTDLVGRWGGEEFGIAMPRTDLARARCVAERIRQTLGETQIKDRNGTPIPPPTASQGIAALGEIAHDVDELIDQADHALYLAKARGRDQIAEASAVSETMRQ